MAGTASAGGSWLVPERSALVPAETAVFEGDFSSGSLEGRISDGPYLAFLLPQARWMQGHVVPPAAIQLGELEIVRTNEYLFHARVEFEVPNVPPGLYHIQYCNEPCTVDGIGDLIGSEYFAIGTTRTEARLLILTQRLRWKLDEARARAGQEALTERERLEDESSAQTYTLRAAEVRAGELAGELDRTRLALRVERSRSSGGPVAGALLLLILALLSLVLVMATRLRRVRVDAELHALTIEQPARVDQLS
ncbi:MAG: hypothetical protein ACRDG8_09445 [Actinomycetota bacterium]